MSADTTRRGLLGAVATTGLLGLAGCTGSTPFVGRQLEETRTIPLEGAETLAIDTDIGEISVTSVDRDDIHLDIVEQSSSIRTDLDDLTLEIERTDGRLELRSAWDGSEGWFSSRPAMDLDVEIPRELHLERVDTSTGRITVRDVEGDLTATASTGRVDVSDVDGSVTAETSTGRIEVADVTGTVTADASTGRVEVRDVGRLGDVTTSTGRIDVEVPAIDGDTTLSASTGRITAAIGRDLDAELRASTNTGGIDVGDLPLEERIRRDDRLEGRLGDGGPTLRIETSTGRISLSALE